MDNQWTHRAETALTSARRADSTTERIRLYAYAAVCIEKATVQAVSTARDEKATWQTVANSLGVTRQAAQHKYGKTCAILSGIGEATTEYGYWPMPAEAKAWP